MPYRARARAEAPVRLWLFGCCLLLLAMVVVGGITRLTHSGLSIVEWQPLVGTIPPLSVQEWAEVFAKYQATPEYRLVNHEMSLAEFKGIFWWEYAHRLLGRAIGLFVLVPLAWFVVRRQLARPTAAVLAGVFLLGGVQGAIGWYMVRSGLVDDPRVSPIRLTLHLGVAVLILGLLWWTALDLGARTRADAVPPLLRRASSAVVAVVYLMILSGGLVAGSHAGLAYNTFPTMNGQFVPQDIWRVQPWYMNFVDDLATVQFDHRLIAWTLILCVPALSVAILRRQLPAGVHRAAWLLLAALAMQVTLGIVTLLGHVPVPWAAAHQAGAMFVFAAALNVRHRLR